MSMQKIICIPISTHGSWHAVCMMKISSEDLLVKCVSLARYTELYYPPRNVFVLNTGKYRPGCIIFVYTGAPVL